MGGAVVLLGQEGNGAAPLHARHRLAPLGVDAGAVVALGEVLDDELPVAFHVVFDAGRHLELAGVVVLEEIAGPAERRIGEQASRIGAKMRVEEALPLFERDLVETEAGLVEVLRRKDVRRGQQLAIEAVGPGVIGADDDAVEGAALRRAERRPAVPTGVVKSVQDLLPVPRDENAAAGDVHRDVVAGVGDLARPSYADPPVVEKHAHLAFVERGVEVMGAGEGGLDLVELAVSVHLTALDIT